MDWEDWSILAMAIVALIAAGVYLSLQDETGCRESPPGIITEDC
jgi:hypothetical protein